MDFLDLTLLLEENDEDIALLAFSTPKTDYTTTWTKYPVDLTSTIWATQWPQWISV